MQNRAPALSPRDVAIGPPPAGTMQQSGNLNITNLGTQALNVGVFLFGQLVQPAFWIGTSTTYYTGGITLTGTKATTVSFTLGSNAQSVSSIFLTTTTTTISLPANPTTVAQSCSFVVTDVNGTLHDPIIVVTPG